MLRYALAFLLFAAAAGAAWLLAPRLASLAEARYAAQVEATLTAGGFGWVSAEVDGLNVTLNGLAPSDTAGAEAVAMISAISPALVIRNDIAEAPTIEPTIIPPELEILKGANGLILAGVIEDEAMVELLGGDQTLLRYGAAPFSADWSATSAILSTLANTLRHARITVTADTVAVDGLTKTEEARGAITPLTKQLSALGWRTAIRIEAPPPALTDFRLTITKTQDGAEVACAAASAADAALIETAITKQLAASARCAIGAGAPDNAWADAAAAVLTALAPLKTASAEMSGKLVTLTLAPPVTLADAASVAEALSSNLPPGYRFVLNDDAIQTDTDSPPPFSLTIDWPGGNAPITITSAQSGDGLTRAETPMGAYARALFPGVEATFTATTGAKPPNDWRRIARVGLEALSKLNRGAVQMTDGAVTLNGVAAQVGDIRAAHDGFAAAGPEWRITTRIAHDPAPIAAAQPLPPSRCAALVAEAIADAPVSFQPASATLTTSGGATVEQIATILQRCEGAMFEIGGHTDAQGSETGNLALSRNRAEAVLTALLAAKAPPGRLIAKGYGEARPIADNATAVGRALNRRIEFTLIEDPE